MTDSGSGDRTDDRGDGDDGASADGRSEDGRPSGDEQRRSPSGDPASERDDVGYVEWLLTTDEPGIVVLRDVVSSVGTVVLVGLLLFAVSGIWPPLVAVESGSMEPHMQRGDLVFVMEEQRFAPGQSVAETGVVTYEAAQQVDRENGDKQGYRSFGSYGNVIVYERGGRPGSPIIHRAHLYVEEGEHWVSRANPDYLEEGATCETVATCPAPYDGFVTKGDANSHYDQAGRQAPRISGIVREEWIRGRAKARVPFLGHVRLLFGSVGSGSPGTAPSLGSDGGVAAASGGVAATSGPGAGAGGVGGSTTAVGGLLALATRLLAVGGVVGALAYGTRN